MPPNITPPIRTSLLTQNGAPLSIGTADIQTTRDWWMYWNQLGDQANANSRMVSEGGHADRPVTDNLPDGAIYVESDRGVIYQNQGGNWQYVAGVMYGTLSPDQRPTDLGLYDGGFEYRATDSDPANTGRDFIWSGTAWVETTPVLYGTHALRPAIADAPARCIYVETDRGAIYQNQLGVWEYLAGTMWGTLVPDQRPTDLGPHDAGFTFRTTVAPPEEFIWSGGGWVEVTPVTGAVNLTHPNVVTKVGATTGQIVEGGITDLSAGNSGKITILASGNVGVNWNTPTDTFMVRPPSGHAGITIQNKSQSPADESTLTVLHNVTGYGWRARAQDADGGLALDVQNASTWLTNAIIVPSISGYLGLGMTPAFRLQLSTDSAAKPATSTWTVSSDIRLKQNMLPVKDDSLAILRELNWVRFEYNGQANTPRGVKAIGLVAQELQEYLPEAVQAAKSKLNETDTEEIDLLAIDYHHIIAHSARAIQQLDLELKTLRALIGKP